MEKIQLTAVLRNKDEKSSDLRQNSKVPAVVYWHKQESLPLTLDASDLLRTYRVAWESQIVTLEVDSKKIEVLIHEVQRHPVSGAFTHVDFFALTRGEKLTAKIPVSFIWNSQAVKEGGILEELTKEIEVKCLPKDLIPSFEVDLSKLEKFGDLIKVSDLDIDSKYEIENNPNDVVVQVSKPKKLTKEETTEDSSNEETTEEK